MAGDWIPMRIDLRDDPAVIAIATATGLDEDTITGKLLRLWSWANKHLEDGSATVSEAWVDRYLNAPGFAKAMIEAGWLQSDGTGVIFPKFDRWNSQGAKRRVIKTAQKQSERESCRQNVASEKDVIPRPMRNHVLDRDGHKCVVCGWSKDDAGPPVGLASGERLSIDHIIPESRGGETIASNLVTLCMKCNQQKSNRTFEEAGMSPDLSHITGDKMATNSRPEKRREQKRREQKREEKTAPPSGGGVSHPEVLFPEALDSPECREAWARWKADRKARRKPVTVDGEATALRKLLKDSGGSPDVAVGMIETSIANGWTGLFPPAKAAATAKSAPAVVLDPFGDLAAKYAKEQP